MTHRIVAVAAWVAIFAVAEPCWAAVSIVENFDDLAPGSRWPSDWEVNIEGYPVGEVSVSKAQSLTQPNCGMLLTTNTIDAQGSMTAFSVRRPFSPQPPGSRFDLGINVRLPHRISDQFALSLEYDAPAPKSTCLVFSPDNTIALHLDGENVSGVLPNWTPDTWMHVHWTMDHGAGVSTVEINSNSRQSFKLPPVYQSASLSSFLINLRQGVPLPAYVDNIALAVEGAPAKGEDIRSDGGNAGLVAYADWGGGGLGGGGGSWGGGGTGGGGGSFVGLSGFGGLPIAGGGAGSGGGGGGGSSGGPRGGGGNGDGGGGSGDDGGGGGGGVVVPEPTTFTMIGSLVAVAGFALGWRRFSNARTRAPTTASVL